MSDTRNLLTGHADRVIEKNLVRICFCSPLLILWIVLGNIFHFDPNFALKSLYIPSLDKSLNSSTNSSIAFDIYFKNTEMYSNAYLDPINVTFYADSCQNHSNRIISFTIPEFFLAAETEVEYSGMVNATGLDLAAAKHEIAANGFQVFKLDLKTSVRYDFYAFWKTGRHVYQKSVDAKIDDSGTYGGTSYSLPIWVSILLLIILIMLTVCVCTIPEWLSFLRRHQFQ